MTPAFAWALCLMGAVVMVSIVLTGAGRAKADFTMADLQAPRAMFERLPAFGQRAVWAQENSWEALTLGAPAMLLCLISGVSSPTAIAAAWIWPGILFHLSICLCRQRPTPEGTLLGCGGDCRWHLLRGGTAGRDQRRRLISRNTEGSPPSPCPQQFVHSPAGFHCREMRDRSTDHSG